SVAVAVRSSGVAEDLADDSFAGLHDTVLDVVGEEAVLAAVRRCWASQWTARAVAYRQARGYGHGDALAVVVQRMVAADAAGVMFTANPLSTATDEIVINASWGLGEAIVSGITTPDQFTLARGDLRVKERVLGSKEVQVPPGAGEPRETPAADRERFALTDEQLARLGELGRRVQAFHGEVPQDIEWALAGEQLHLLQTRPVTGVDLTWDAELEYWQRRPVGPDDQLWTRAWSDAIWNGGCTPLMYTLRAHVYTDGQGEAMSVWGHEELGSLRLFKYHKGTPYYNCAVERAMLSTAFPITRPGMLAMVPPAWHEEILAERFSLLDYARLQARCQFLAPSNGLTSWRRQVDRYLVDGLERANGLPDAELARLSDAELERHLGEMNAYDCAYMADVWSAFLLQARDAMGLLGVILAKWYRGGRARVFTDLLTGVPRPTATQIENAALWELAQGILGSPTLSRAFAAHPGAAFFTAAADSEDGPAWLERYRAFLAEHGHRGHANRDVYHPRRAEDPALDYRALAAFVAAGETERPSAKEQAVEARRQRVVAEVAEDLRGGTFGALRAQIFLATMDYVMTFLLFRDDERHWLDRVTFSIKRAFKEVGRRLRARGLLEREDDLYFLSDHELFSLLHGSPPSALLDAKIAARRRHFERLEAGGSNPMYVQHDRDADHRFDVAPGAEAGDGVLRGLGTSGGAAEGTARVIRTLEEIGRVAPGEILVVNATDPGWTPVFLVIGAVVIETGGLLAHGSCLAREYGMPAVHLPGATAAIPDGATVRVNGDSGTVEVVSALEQVAA
ncbi:MAG TPA: PEP/pyruvate-binding domain-containing protein, partial [Solirubrobacteraceae bacterium]|nr:PEP/pyruvate-binding domain-containing protein [Solirubrobacteraceae bacterium]